MKLLEINGHKVLFKRYPKDSEFVNIKYIVNAGSMLETKEEYGVAHFLEHMFFKGTKNRSYKELNLLQARLGSFNAYTSFDRTVYYCTVLRDCAKKAIDVFFDMIFEPAFIPSEFNKEKGVIAEECTSRQKNPDHFFNIKVYEHLFGAHGHDIVGDVSKITIDQLIKFREKYYSPNNAIISIVGGISENKIVEYLAEVLPFVDYGKLTPAVQITSNFDNLNLEHLSKQTSLLIVSNGLSLFDDIKYNFAYSILINGIGGGLHSLFMDKIREELGLCYFIYSYDNEYYNKPFTFTYTHLENKNINKVIDEVYKIISQVKKNGFDKELLSTCKHNWLYNLYERMDDSNGYNDVMTDDYFRYGKVLMSSYNDIKGLVKRLTNDDIVNVANTRFTEFKIAKLLGD